MGFDRRIQKPKNDKQKIVTILFGILTGFILFVIFDMPEEDHTNIEEFENENIRDSHIYEYDFKTSKKILFYTPRYQQEDWGIGEGNTPFHK